MIILTILLGIAFIFLGRYLLARKRALSHGTWSFKYGMYFDTRTDSLIGTKTPIYFDSQTGLYFTGKPKLSK